MITLFGAVPPRHHPHSPVDELPAWVSRLPHIASVRHAVLLLIAPVESKKAMAGGVGTGRRPLFVKSPRYTNLQVRIVDWNSRPLGFLVRIPSFRLSQRQSLS